MRPLHPISHRSSKPKRRGLAPLEMVMTLPILFGMLVFLFGMGEFVIKQSQVVIKARNQAWKLRESSQSERPFFFEPRGENSDLMTKTVTDKVDLPEAIGDLVNPEADHTVMVGAWDHTELPMDNPVHLEEMGMVALAGGTAEIQRVISSAQYLLNNPSADLAGAVLSFLAEGMGVQTQSENVLAQLTEKGNETVETERRENQEKREEAKADEAVLDTMIALAEKLEQDAMAEQKKLDEAVSEEEKEELGWTGILLAERIEDLESQTAHLKHVSPAKAQQSIDKFKEPFANLLGEEDKVDLKEIRTQPMRNDFRQMKQFLKEYQSLLENP